MPNTFFEWIMFIALGIAFGLMLAGWPAYPL